MRKRFLLFVLIVAGSSRALGQAVSFGVKGGISFTDQTTYHDESRPYLVGPFVELRLPAGFAVEASALYHRIGNSTGYVAPQSILAGSSLISFPFLSSYNLRARGNAWEFAFLGKYYFRRRSSGWQPFVGTGWALRTVTLHERGSQTSVDQNGVAQTFSFQNSRSDFGVGAVAAAGVRLRAGRIAVIPEIRYTRWGSAVNSLPKNEAGFLLGISF